MAGLSIAPNRGVIFMNRDRRRVTHSQMKGEIDVEGVRYIIDLYENVSIRNELYYKVRLEKMRNQPGGE